MEARELGSHASHLPFHRFDVGLQVLQLLRSRGKIPSELLHLFAGSLHLRDELRCLLLGEVLRFLSQSRVLQRFDNLLREPLAPLLLLLESHAVYLHALCDDVVAVFEHVSDEPDDPLRVVHRPFLERNVILDVLDGEPGQLSDLPRGKTLHDFLRVRRRPIDVASIVFFFNAVFGSIEGSAG